MGQFDSAKNLIVETAQELTRKGYLMATGGNLSVRIAGQSALARAHRLSRVHGRHPV